jgi:hypothetical protein
MNFFLPNSPTVALAASLLRFLDHTHPVGLLYMSDWPLTQASTYTTHEKQGTNIHTFTEIRTSNPSSQVAADLRLPKPHAHRDRLWFIKIAIFYGVVVTDRTTQDGCAFYTVLSRMRQQSWYLLTLWTRTAQSKWLWSPLYLDVVNSDCLSADWCFGRKWLWKLLPLKMRSALCA